MGTVDADEDDIVIKEELLRAAKLAQNQEIALKKVE